MDDAANKQAKDDADAQLSNNNQLDELVFSTDEELDQLVDVYTRQESADNDQQKRLNALALSALTSSNADSLAAAMTALDSQSPGPWNDLAAAQAAANAAMNDATALAQLGLSESEADLEEINEQAVGDAIEARDDAEALVQRDEAESTGQAQRDNDVAQYSTEGENIPDAILPPDDGPAPTLAADFSAGFEAFFPLPLGAGQTQAASGPSGQGATAGADNLCLGPTTKDFAALVSTAFGLLGKMESDPTNEMPVGAGSQFNNGAESNSLVP